MPAIEAELFGKPATEAEATADSEAGSAALTGSV